MSQPSSTSPSRSRRAAATAVSIVVLALLAVVGSPSWAVAADGGPNGATGSAGTANGDPNLDQTIDPDEPIVHGDDVIETGHVDMGPKFDGNRWKFLIHDDAHKADANATTVWRYPDETVLRVVDAAKLKVPEDKTYSFVGADPGSTVWVVPQTQNPAVVWAGWNTQDPTVMSRLDRGATFSVTGVEGPGTMTVYLQSGDFGAPQVLWDSRRSGAQSVWVDSNTHTHANWVFTKPGVYLVQLQASATLTDGSTVSDTEVLRFAVGSATSPDEAMKAAWKGTTPAPVIASPSEGAVTTPDGTPPPTTPVADEGSDHGVLVPILIAAIIVVAMVLVAAFAATAVRSSRARRRVLAARTASGPTGDGATGDGATGDGQGRPGDEGPTS